MSADQNRTHPRVPSDPEIAAVAAPDVVHRARPHHRHRRRARWTAALLGAAILILAAACGTSAKASNTAAGGTSTTAKGGSGSSSFAAYAACLKKNGVTLPTGFGGGRPGGTGGTGGGAPTGTFRPGGAGGAGGAAAGFRNNPAFQKADKACASLRPKTGFGGRGGAGSTAFQAFASCMSSHGITVRGRGPGAGGGSTSSSTASTVAPTTVDTSSPQYQAAYGICKALLPTPGASTSTTAAT